MPCLVKAIDKIAREKNRDVLFVHFDREIFPETYQADIPSQCLNFLKQHEIIAYPCIPFSLEFVILQYGYMDYFYIDVPFDESLEQYVLVRDFFEKPNGSMRFQGITFYLLPLEMAMKNKHRDDEMFYENL